MENSARASEESHKSNPAARGGGHGGSGGGKPEVALAKRGVGQRYTYKVL